MRILTSLIAFSSLPLALLAACGSGHTPDPAAAAPVAHTAAKAADTPSVTLVAAVASTKAGTPPIPVQVKFALHEHPQAGDATEMDLVLIPRSEAIERVFGTVQGEEGLTVVSGADLAETHKPVEGVPIKYTLKVLAQQDGIYELTATVSVDMGGILSSQIYAIPVLAGRGMADLPAAGTVTAPSVAGKPAAPPAKP